jgi:biopolymer transport protein ExbD
MWLMASLNDEQDEPISAINVVPLVDIVLVVLIIFMVAAPMIMKPSINVNLPKAASGEATEPSRLAITLLRDGRLFVNGSSFSDQALQGLAAAELAKNPEVQAIISADQEVAHGRVVSVMDIVKSVGIKRFAISIEKRK